MLLFLNLRINQSRKVFISVFIFIIWILMICIGIVISGYAIFIIFIVSRFWTFFNKILLNCISIILLILLNRLRLLVFVVVNRLVCIRLQCIWVRWVNFLILIIVGSLKVLINMVTSGTYFKFFVSITATSEKEFLFIHNMEHILASIVSLVIIFDYLSFKNNCFLWYLKMIMFQ